MNVQAYHGTNRRFQHFSVDTQNVGIDQYGSGFYFTASKEQATGYALDKAKSNGGTPIVLVRSKSTRRYFR